MSINNSSQNKKNKKIIRRKATSFALLASVLVLSSVATVQLATSNAYAQSSGGPTVTGSCHFDDSHGLVTDFDVRGGEPFPTLYYGQLLDSSGIVLNTGLITFESSDSLYSLSLQTPESGEEYTFNLYQDVNNNYQGEEVVEENELVASATTTCPSYTELFSNQGQCMQFAKDHPFGSITKRGCQEAF